MELTSLVGLTPRLIANRKTLLDQNYDHVTLGPREGRQSPSIAIGTAGPSNRNRAIKKLAQPAGGDQALGEFRVVARTGDLGRVRLNKAELYGGALELEASRLGGLAVRLSLPR